MNLCPIIDFKCCCKKNIPHTETHTRAHTQHKATDVMDTDIATHTDTPTNTNTYIKIATHVDTKTLNTNDISLHEPTRFSMNYTSDSASDSASDSIPDSENINIDNNNICIEKYKTNYGNFYICTHVYNEDIDDKQNKTIIFDHYRKENYKLPIKGWFHKCLWCSCITGNSMFYTRHNNIRIYIHICGNCVYLFNQNEKNIDSMLKKDLENVLKNIDKKFVDIINN